MRTDELETSAIALRDGVDAAESSTPLLWLGAFGVRPDDLDVDLSVSSPAAVTEVLARCGRAGSLPATRQAFEELTVGTRTRALLLVVAASQPRPLQVMHRCGACQETLEVDVPIRQIAELGSGGPKRVSVDADRRWVVRLPSGLDQLRWKAMGISDPLAMARSLVVEGDTSDVDDGWLERFGDVMQRVDPLIDFAVSVRCPGCGAAGAVHVELQELALEELRRIQRALMIAVHRLASVYHWSERDILAMPAWRRDAYVAWVQPDEAWS